MSLNGYIVELESSMKGAVSQVAELQAEVAELKSMMLSYLAKEQRCPSLSESASAAPQPLNQETDVRTEHVNRRCAGST